MSWVASAMASSEPIPDALSSAPGAWGTVSRCAPIASHGSPGTTSPLVAIRLTLGPPSTGTPHDTPPGVGNRCRVTSHPKPSSRSCTNSAASKYASVCPGRGPILFARWLTARTAIPTLASSGLTLGVGVGVGVTGSVVGGALVGSLVGLVEIVGVASGSPSSVPEQAVSSITTPTTGAHRFTCSDCHSGGRRRPLQLAANDACSAQPRRLPPVFAVISTDVDGWVRRRSP